MVLTDVFRRTNNTIEPKRREEEPHWEENTVDGCMPGLGVFCFELCDSLSMSCGWDEAEETCALAGLLGVFLLV